MAINDVLPLRAARLDTIANIKCFWGPEIRDQWLNFDGFICLHYSAPPYSHRISAIYLLPFGKVWLTSLCWPACNAWQRSSTQNLQRVGKNSGPILSRLWTKVHEIFRWCRRRLTHSKSLADCLYRLLFRSHSPYRRKTEQMYKVLFWPPIFREGQPQLFYGRLLSRFIVHRLTKFGWVPIAISACQAW